MTENLPPDSNRRAWRTDREWHRLRERIDGAELPPVARPRYTRWVTAAAAVVVAAATIYGWRLARARDAEPRLATTAAGERIVIRLADSSTITLGPASTVRYIVSARRREVELDGLADFKVVHDASRPFIVRAKNAATTDLGTEFVVRAYRSDSIVRVAVTEGAVSLAGIPGSTAIELRPGSVGRVSPSGAPSLDTTGTASASAAWVQGRLVFRDEPLSAVAEELERWFDADIDIANETLARRRVTAVYNDPSLSGVLEALEATFGVRIERTGRTITISERPR